VLRTGFQTHTAGGSLGAWRFGSSSTEHYRPFTADFNGDDLADIGLRDPTNGIFYIRFGPNFDTQTAYGWATGDHYQAFAADFNGDNIADIGVRDPSNGIFYIRFGPSFGTQTAYGWATGSHYRPFAADLNGDGLAEIGLRDPSNGIFYWRYGPSFGTQGAYGWATGTHYQPYAADFNGDNPTEIGVRDPSNGIFYWRYGLSFDTQGAYGWAAGQPRHKGVRKKPLVGRHSTSRRGLSFIRPVHKLGRSQNEGSPSLALTSAQLLVAQLNDGRKARKAEVKQASFLSKHTCAAWWISVSSALSAATGNCPGAAN
jgi:hypothetical protein